MLPALPPLPVRRRRGASTAPPIVYWPAVVVAASVALVLSVGLVGLTWGLSPRPSLSVVAEQEALATQPSPDEDQVETPAAEPASAPKQAVAKVERQRAEEVRPAPAAPPVTPVQVEQERAAAPLEAPAGKPPTALLGTTVEFVDNPQLAARTAAREGKLLYVLHVSGNFEDPQFT
jgi:hypothetical protein